MQKENATVLSCLDAIRSELRCGICLSTLRDPKITNCQHMYCKQCLYDYMSTRREKKDRFCPLCKTTLDLRQCTEGDYASTLVQNYLELAKKFLREVRNPCFSIPKEKAFLESQAVFDPASVASPVRTFQVPLPILQVKQKPTRAKRRHVLQFSTIYEAETEESSGAVNIEKELKSPVLKKTRLESVTLTETKTDKPKDQQEPSTSVLPNASRDTSTVGGLEEVETTATARIPGVAVAKAVQTEDVEEIELLKSINIEALIQYHQEHHRVSALAALLFLLPPLERLLKESKDDVLELIGVREASNSASDVDAHDETLPCYENVPATSHAGEERVENGSGEKVTSRSSSIVPDSDGEGIGGMDSFYDDDATMILAPGEDAPLLPNSQSRRVLEELQELIEKEEQESPRKPVTISTHETLGSLGIQLPSKINDPIPFDENGKLIDENRLARLLTPKNSRNLDASGSTSGRRTVDSPSHGIHVAFAGIDSLNKEVKWAVTEFRFKFGAKLKFTKDVLHKANYVVYMNDENGIIPHRVRSLIYVSAVAAGVPIVGGAWVRNCLKHGKLFNPNHYLEKTDSPVQLPPSARSKNGEKLFAGYRFAFPEKYSDSSFVTRNELIDIVKLAGAEVVEDMNSLALLDQEKDKIIFAVGSAECHAAKRMEMEFACTVLMGDWILDSLKYFKVVPKVDKYRVSQRMPSFKRPLVEISQKTSSNVKKEKRKQIPVPVQEDSSSISIF